MNKENYKQYEALPEVAQEYFNQFISGEDEYISDNLEWAAGHILQSDEKSKLLFQAFHESDFRTMGYILHRQIEEELIRDAEDWYEKKYAPSADQAEESAILAKAEL